MEQRKPKYKIGQKFKPMGKNSTYTVKDIYLTYNSQNDLISIRYVCDYLFCEQIVTDYDVPETTIARSMQIDSLDDL